MGIQYLHHHGRIHRDIRARNILLHGNGQVMVSDFTQTTTLKTGQKINQFVGSPQWMAPEVVEQKEGYDDKADMWSLGILAIEISDGVVPYSDMPELKVLY